MKVKICANKNIYGVDVNSGCKNQDGIKDRTKVIEFVKNAKSIK